MLVERRRAAHSGNVSDPDPIAFRANLEIGDVKDSQCDVSQISQLWIIESNCRIRGRGLRTVHGKTGGNVKRRISGPAGITVQMNCVREMAASYFSVVAYYVAAIERVRR